MNQKIWAAWNEGMGKITEATDEVGRPLAAAQRELSGFAGGLSSVLSSPGRLAAQVQGLLSRVTSLAGTGSSGLTSLLSLFGSSKSSRSGYSGAGYSATAYSGAGSTATGYSGAGVVTYASPSAAQTAYGTAMAQAKFGTQLPAVAGTSTTSKAQAAYQAAAIALVQQSALAEAAIASADMEWDTYDDAVKTSDELASALNAEIRATTDDQVKISLRKLLAAVVRDIATRGADLTKLSEVTPDTTLPALVIAHQILGDATRAGEILSRNPGIKDPLAVPGGKPIKVVAA